MRESIKKMRASSPSPATTSDDCVSLPDESGVIIKNKSEPPQLISTILKVIHTMIMIHEPLDTVVKNLVGHFFIFFSVLVVPSNNQNWEILDPRIQT